MRSSTFHKKQLGEASVRMTRIHPFKSTLQPAATAASMRSAKPRLLGDTRTGEVTPDTAHRSVDAKRSP
jgi:hypothetical protein